MNENDFQQKLGDLMGEISTLPKAERDKLAQLAQQTKERHGKLKETVGQLQESLDYLRLSIKYLVFDLEATRRENGYLRKMLEDAPGNQGTSGQGNHASGNHASDLAEPQELEDADFDSFDVSDLDYDSDDDADLI